MKNYDVILFDLDGTLTDSGDGIMDAAAWAMEKMGLPPRERAWMRRFVGPPLLDSFRDLCGLGEADRVRAVAYYREYYGEKGILENSLYPGIPEMLGALRAAGKRLVIATSKAEPVARQVVANLRLGPFFEYVAGGRLDGTRTEKDEVIAYALESCGAPGRSRAVMVGDRYYDLLGARKAGVDSVGVLYGYGSREEMTRAGATYVAATVEELGGILLGRDARAPADAGE